MYYACSKYLYKHIISMEKLVMEKVIEFNLEEKQLKEYIEESLKEKNINYEIKVEDRWIQRYYDASKYYQVYCLYVDKNYLNEVKNIIRDFEEAVIVTEDIEELQGEEDNDNKYKIFTLKNFLKYYWVLLIIIVLIIILSKI